MQLTPELLQQFAEKTVDQLVQADPSIIAAYQCGSTVLDETPLLGGPTDIDIVIIHTAEPPFRRDVLRLTDGVHRVVGLHNLV